MKKDPSREWGPSEIAQELIGDSSKRNKIFYHLHNLVEEHLIEKVGEQYRWIEKSARSDAYFHIVQDLVTQGPMKFKDFEEMAKKHDLSGENPKYTYPNMVADGLIRVLPGRILRIWIGPSGASLLEVCFECGKPLGDGPKILAQDRYRDFEYRTAIIHPACLHKLRGLPGMLPHLCEECKLPLGSLELRDLLLPRRQNLVHETLLRCLDNREVEQYSNLGIKKRHEAQSAAEAKVDETARDADEETEDNEAGVNFDPYRFSEWEPLAADVPEGFQPIIVFCGRDLPEIMHFLTELDNCSKFPSKEDLTDGSLSRGLYPSAVDLRERATWLHAQIKEAITAEEKCRHGNEVLLLQYYYGVQGQLFQNLSRGPLKVAAPGDDDVLEDKMTAPVLIRGDKCFHPKCYERKQGKEEG